MTLSFELAIFFGKYYIFFLHCQEFRQKQKRFFKKTVFFRNYPARNYSAGNLKYSPAQKDDCGKTNSDTGVTFQRKLFLEDYCADTDDTQRAHNTDRRQEKCGIIPAYIIHKDIIPDIQSERGQKNI
jgi:hypothetical protein